MLSSPGARVATRADSVTPIDALAQRLRSTAEVLLDDVPAAADAGRTASLVLDQLVDHVRASQDEPSLWLLWTAVAAAFPTPDELVAARRTMVLEDTPRASAWLLEACLTSAASRGAPLRKMDVIVDQVVVDVDFCARNDLHTGIQRVVRETMPRWERDHELTMVAWTTHDGAFRGLTEPEVHRVLRWGTPHEPSDAPSTHPRRLLIPWRCTVVIPESVEAQRSPLLSAIAQFSGNALTGIGYDCIPAVSPDLVHPALPDRFAQYLTVIKHIHRVAAISASATAEFEGFASMVRTQGLPGPTVTEVELPVEVPAWVMELPIEPSEPPLVVCVGSFEPRKNQVALMFAAERLWREGLSFRLLFIGGGGWVTEFDETLKSLASAGRPVRRRTAITEAELWAAYRSARLTVFASLHEGYGLPLAESLACGTPVITTDFGSTREVAEGGGALLVDPRDDEQLTDALRRMLTDDDLVARLTAQARSRAPRTWDDYADELWAVLTPRLADSSKGTT